MPGADVQCTGGLEHGARATGGVLRDEAAGRSYQGDVCPHVEIKCNMTAGLVQPKKMLCCL